MSPKCGKYCMKRMSPIFGQSAVLARFWLHFGLISGACWDSFYNFLHAFLQLAFGTRKRAAVIIFLGRVCGRGRARRAKAQKAFADMRDMHFIQHAAVTSQGEVRRILSASRHPAAPQQSLRYTGINVFFVFMIWAHFWIKFWILFGDHFGVWGVSLGRFGLQKPPRPPPDRFYQMPRPLWV